MPLTIEIPPDLEPNLRDVAERHGVDPETYILGALRQQVGTPLDGGLPAAESALLERLSEGLPEETWGRYQTLLGRSEDETLTGEERSELIHLSDIVEEWNADRVEIVGELARLRGVPFPALWKELGLAPPSDA